MRRSKTVLLCAWLLVVWGSAGFSLAQSMKFVKAIYLPKPAGKASVASLLLGKKKKKPLNPVSICRLSPDRLCLTDSVNGKIIILNGRGKILKRIDKVKGVKLGAPVSVCTDGSGYFYVSDSVFQAVLKFDSRYKFRDIFYSASGVRITGITYKDGFFYMVDTANHRIIKLDKRGKPIAGWGKRGTAPGEFNYPTHIAAGKKFLYVTDAMNFRVQVLDYGGKAVRVFGTFGRGGGNFSKPKGIAVDEKQRIYVADAMFDNVQIFNIKGEFLYYFGGPGQETGQFWMPTGLMTDRNDTIWVTDTYNNRLQLFHLEEETP